MNDLQTWEIEAGLRMTEYPDLSGMSWEPREDRGPRVKWVNKLREIVARRMPRNKMGTPMVSDVDLLFATDGERKEALESIIKKK